MAYQDPNFNFYRGGSVAASAATFHRLFPEATSYTGLSLLNSSEVLIIEFSASTGLGYLTTQLNSLALSDVEYFVSPSTQVQTFKRTAGTTSQIGIVGIGTNFPIIYWSIWARNPL